MQGLGQEHHILILVQFQEDTKQKDKPPLYFRPLSGEDLRSDSEQNVHSLPSFLSGKGGVNERKQFSRSHCAEGWFLFFNYTSQKFPVTTSLYTCYT